VRTRRREPRQVDGELIDDGLGFTAEVDAGAVVVRVPKPAPADGAHENAGESAEHGARGRTSERSWTP
jgi:hypothetical protein